MRINARLKDRVLMRYNNETFLPVGDNSDYIIHFDIADSDRKTAMFAKFVRSGREQEISLDEDGNANIPLWVLKEGYFKVGLTADGFSSTPMTVGVRESINNEKLTQTQDPEPEKIDMLIALVNGIKQGGIQSDQEQNDDSQPDYIRNRTHYKETNSEGQVVYHTLDNKYLNLDNEVRQDSNNPVTAKAVYKVVNEAEPEALTNFEIEELLKNFV